MKRLDVENLRAASAPVIERFAAIEPQPWTYKAILLELIGEIGSLAHLVQHWEGFKRGLPGPAQLGDECSDVLFMILRLACSENIPLPPTIEIEEQRERRPIDQVLELSTRAAALQDSHCNPSAELVGMLAALGRLANCLGIDLMQAHKFAMEIAFFYFEASGSHWPRPQPLRYPLATFYLARLLWKKRISNQ